MIKVKCDACRADYHAPSAPRRCKRCGSPRVRAMGGRAWQRTPLEELPPEGRKLRAFLDAMGWSEPELARRIRALGHKCSRSMVQQLIHERTDASYELSRCIIGMMRQRGFEPAVFHPDALSGKRPRRRRDFRKWMARQTESEA